MRGYEKGLVFAACVTAAAAFFAAPAVRAEDAPVQDNPAAQQGRAPVASINEIRDAIQAANDRDGSGVYEGIIPYLADKVETEHNPKFPNDGFIDGKLLGESLPYEHRVHDLMMQNRRMDVTFVVKGDEIVIKGQMTGKLVYDGSQLVHPVNMTLTVDHGKIVRIWVDASTPEIMDGYRRQHEAMMAPPARPVFDQWMEVMKAH